MNELTPAPPPTRLLTSLAFVARWSLTLLLLSWLLFIASWGALHGWIVPRIGELRPQLEATVSRLTGIDIRIESITAYSTNLLPAFELGNVRLMDEQGREALHLPTVLVSMTPRSLLALKFDQILIDRPVLNVRRTVDGQIRVAGLDLSRGETDVDMLDRLFSQPEFVIRQGSVVWTDELRGVAPLALRDVDVVMRNRSRQHEFRLDATPPTDWGDRFGLKARFEQPFLSRGNGRWKEWLGQVYADFSRVDVAQLKKYAQLGVEVEQGRGAVRAWVDVQRARIIAATADVVLADVSVRVDPALAPLRLASLSGRLSAKFAPDGFEFATQDLAFDTADAIRWPGGNLTLRQQEAGAGRVASGELLADRMNLAALAQIAGRLPLGATLHKALLRHRPSGLVEQIKVSWKGPIDSPAHYQAQGRVTRFAFQSYPDDTGAGPGTTASIGTPGIRGATVDFALTDTGGKATLAISDGSIDFPGVFAESVVPFQRLSSEVAWQRDGDQVQVQLNKMRFRNADADGELQLKWQTSDPRRASSGARFPGVLDMQGTLSRANATRVHRYLPLVVEPSVRRYVRDAVLDGTGSGVRFKVKGDLWDVPYAHATQGEFLISAPISGATLAYVPRTLQAAGDRPWPALTRLSGELLIDRQSLTLKGVRASADGSPAQQITKGEAVIADLMHASVVAVNLESRGPLSDLLAFVRNSPLGAMTDQALARATGSGNAELLLKLNVPLNDPDRATTHGTLVLQGNDIQVGPDIPRLARARGTIGFTESGFSLNAVQARMLGGDVKLDGGSVVPSAAAGAVRPAGTMAFRLQGVASAEALQQAYELGGATRLAQYASGSAAYAATITLRGATPEFSITSNLAGMALNLPAPLGKSADTTMPVRLESAMLHEPVPENAGASRLQDRLMLDLGRIGSVQYVRDLSGAEPRVVRGAIAVGLASDEVAPLPRDGVVANIRLGDLDLDVWERLFAQVAGGAATSGPTAAVAPPAWGGAMRDYLPSTLALRARSLTTGGRTLNDLVAGGSRDGQTWRANVEAQQLSGYVEYRQSTGAGAGRLFARLARLTLAPTAASAVESLLDEQPQTIPALDIVVDELELRARKLGRVEIEAVNRAASGRADGAREWRLNQFDVIAPEAVFRATGQWAAVDAQQGGAAGGPRGRAGSASERRRTVMKFRLDIRDSGEFLARMGMKDVVRRGNGHMQGQVSWAGSPFALDYGSLSGAFIVNIENGQFLKAEPGLAKLLGVLSLQSLPRRLVLDFRDVFSDGFAFDFFRGDVRIDQGIAYSDNLQMKGVNAAVLMDGEADLARETQDLRVVVVPEINAGTASLIAAAINPALGLGSFLAQFVLRRPLMEAATQEFHVDGTWLDPRIQRVRLKAGGADMAPGASDTK